MNGRKMCPIPKDDGGDCWGEPHPDSRQGLCVTHFHEIARDSGAAPATRVRCEECGQISLRAPAYGADGRCVNQNCATDAAARREAETARLDERNRKTRTEVVYYLRFGDRIKIGTTSNLKQRISAIYHDELLAVEPGGYVLEQERHRAFAASRVEGQREWFAADSALVDHAASIAATYGDPSRYLG